jgi:RecA-family ATPase
MRGDGFLINCKGCHRPFVSKGRRCCSTECERKFKEHKEIESTRRPKPFIEVDITKEPIPMREWLVHDRIPANNVTLLSGEGGIGKSLPLLQLSAAHVLGRDWIGYMPERGPVLYFSCEEDADEICRRLETIATHYGTTRRAMRDQGLHLISRAGMDAVLGRADRNGNVEPTILFSQLQFMAQTHKPKAIMLDTAADVFAGNENDRAQARQFITLLRGLAIGTGAAAILVTHPSLHGTNSGSGLSGSTAWHNSVRARMYFKPATGDKDGNTLRMLEFSKNNYGPIGETALVRWRNGVYVPEPRAGSQEKQGADHRAENVFLALLRRFADQGRSGTLRVKKQMYVQT